jgi:hypothetical protein
MVLIKPSRTEHSFKIEQPKPTRLSPQLETWIEMLRQYYDIKVHTHDHLKYVPRHARLKGLVQRDIKETLKCKQLAPFYYFY